MLDAESVSGSDSSSSHVSNMLGKRKSHKTIGQYVRKYRHFIEWISRNHPELVDQIARGVDIIPPNKLSLITATQLVGFFDYICLKRNKTTHQLLIPKTYQSFQHVSGYKSAIKNHFNEVSVLYNT